MKDQKVTAGFPTTNRGGMFGSWGRFSDAGNDELSTRSGGRRSKAPRHEIAGDTLRRFVPRAQLWGFERRTCLVHAGARREVERLGRAKHAGAFALSAARPEKRGSSGNLLGER